MENLCLSAILSFSPPIHRLICQFLKCISLLCLQEKSWIKNFSSLKNTFLSIIEQIQTWGNISQPVFRIARLKDDVCFWDNSPSFLQLCQPTATQNIINQTLQSWAWNISKCQLDQGLNSRFVSNYCDRLNEQRVNHEIWLNGAVLFLTSIKKL